MEEGQLLVDRDDEQAIGLGDRAGDLGEVFGAGDPDRDRQPDAAEDIEPELCGDRRGRAANPPKPADFEEGLVDRQPLDDRCRVVEDVEDIAARLRVGVHARGHHDGIGTQPQGLAPAHRGSDAEGLRLVARRHDDSAADDDRPAPQRGVVALLDRREEGVEVGVQHGPFVRGAGHTGIVPPHRDNRVAPRDDGRLAEGGIHRLRFSLARLRVTNCGVACLQAIDLLNASLDVESCYRDPSFSTPMYWDVVRALSARSNGQSKHRQIWALTSSECPKEVTSTSSSGSRQSWKVCWQQAPLRSC